MSNDVERLRKRQHSHFSWSIYTPGGSMARILVIEDEAPIRGNLLRFIRLEGYEAVEATDGRSGLQAVQDQLPDLIFCDVMMPLLNGLDLLAAIQQAPALRHIPLIFLSASAEPELLDEALRRGASGYLTKPFNFTQLRAVLQQHLPLSAVAGNPQTNKLALD